MGGDIIKRGKRLTHETTEIVDKALHGLLGRCGLMLADARVAER